MQTVRALLARLGRSAVLAAGLLTGACAALAQPSATHELALAERSACTGNPGTAATTVPLPDHVVRTPDSEPTLMSCSYRLALGAPQRNAALYIPGLAAWARVELNGRTLLDNNAIRAVRPALPAGADRIVLIPIPDEAWRPGSDNELHVRVSGRRSFTLSTITLGPLPEMKALHEGHVLGVLVGPLLAAAVVGTLGLSMSLLWLRRRDALFGYFGLGALCWALQTAWGVLPVPLIEGVHSAVWWTTLSALFAVSMIIFCIRFSQWHWPRLARLLWVYALATPLALYGAGLLGFYDVFDSFWRLLLIGIVGLGVAAVAWAAWRRPSRHQLLLLLCGVLGFGFAAHDWMIFEAHWGDNPVYLGPYAGLGFALFVAQLLIDRFARAEQELTVINTELEQRVARQTEQLRQAIEEMRIARDAAEQANQAKTRFLIAASHDLRQPAHALALYLAALRTHVLPPSPAELVQHMQAPLNAMDTMFQALLDVSSIDAGALVPARQPFDLDPLLRRLAEEFGVEARSRGLRLSLRLPASTAVTTDSDPALVERIVRNLLSNAIKYTPKGGVLLACRARREPVPHWSIEVWDSGLGLAPADCQRVFEEFFQAANGRSQRANGLGLGLSIVQRLARLLDAEIRLRSRLDRGSCFALSLPMLARVEPGTAVPAEPADLRSAHEPLPR